MANVSISANLFPYRLSLRQHARLAGEFTVEIENQGANSKLLSMELRLPEQISLDKSGINNSAFKQLKEVVPNSKVRLSFPVFLTQRASRGVFSGKLLVSEHAANFEYPITNYSKEVSFRIID